MACLEPAYDIAGDSFDYAYNDGILHFMIMDAVGHDLGSSFYASLAVGAYRHARRDQLDLDATVKEIDRLIAERFEQTTYVTAQLCELDVATGILQWVNAGHPSPMLVRNGRVIGDIEGRRRVPLGLGYLAGAGRHPIIAEEHLEPNDSLLFYSDGVVEARTAQGEDFGIERLKSFVESAIASRLSSAEITRRLSHAVLDHHGGRLQDDATVLLVNWRPDRRAGLRNRAHHRDSDRYAAFRASKLRLAAIRSTVHAAPGASVRSSCSSSSVRRWSIAT